MNLSEIHPGLRERLVAEGEAALRRAASPVEFTKNRAADELLNDLEGHPHAFLFGCLVDRQIRADRAWMVPNIVRERLGSFEIADLESLTEEQWVRLLRYPEPAHRMPETMGTVLHRATERLVTRYGGDASAIWSGKPSSATLVRRFLEFHGAGPKIATMAANILVRSFHLPLSDYRSIDISADVQVSRVMSRLGFVDQGSDVAVVVHAARELNPDFPGIFDFALWDIGKTVCRPRTPDCPRCRLNKSCAYARAHR